jgi:transcriptional regulator with XRE-family HTH domain
MVTFATKVLYLDPEKVRRAREAIPLTQTALAGMLGVASSLVSKWERVNSDEPRDFTISTLGRLSDALGCKPTDLLSEREFQSKTTVGSRKARR